LIVWPFIKVVQNIPTGVDAERSYDLWVYVTNHVHFDGRSVINPDKPSVFSSPRHNSTRLDIYGVTNMERQDEILSVARQWRATNPIVATIEVRFFEQENWRLFTNEQAGVSGGSRLPENLLRKEFLK